MDINRNSELVYGTTPKLELSSSNTNRFEPAYIRLPKPGTLCKYSGLARSKMNELVLPCAANGFKPPVRSISLRNKGQVKGVRLIVFSSLMDYLNSLETTVTE